MPAPGHQTIQPDVAVVIPIHRQPQFLLDAVTSVLLQSISSRVRTVLVNDGCPLPQTDTLGRFLARANRGRIVYVKQGNAGLADARNRGIRLALSLWPTVRAVFPLDADNALSPTTLERMLERLDSSGAGWVYTDQEAMGARGGVIRHPAQFSVYRLLVSNYCDAGSLIHRRLFDEGLWFESPDPDFPEDWHFFARAALSGFRGAHEPDAGFLYRVLGGAMHASQAGPGRLTAPFWPTGSIPRDGARLLHLEHGEMPRFAFVDPGRSSVTFGSHPALAPSATMPLDAFVALAADRSPAQDGGAPYVPPFAVVAAPEALQALVGARRWDALAFAATGDLARANVTELYIDQETADSLPGQPEAPSVAFLRTGRLNEACPSPPSPLSVPCASSRSPADQHHADVVAAILEAVAGRPMDSADAAIHGNDRAFADAVHGGGRRRFMLVRDGRLTGVVLTAERLASGEVPWGFLAADGPIHLVVLGDEFPAGNPHPSVASSALVRPDERLSVELAGALYPCERTWLVDLPVTRVALAQAAWMGLCPGFLTTATDVLLADPRLGIARKAVMDLGGVVSRYAAVNQRVGALLSAWGVDDASLDIVDDAPAKAETAA